MDKRSFLRLTLAGSSLGIFAPKAVYAAMMESPLKSKLAGGMFFTEDALGRWNKGTATHHIAQIEKQATGGKTQLHVVSAHPMDGLDHFIVKHQLLNQDLKFMQERLYKPTVDKKPEHVFDLGNHHGVVYAVTVCNVHDVWVNMIEV
jgi:superoxide reductase